MPGGQFASAGRTARLWAVLLANVILVGALAIVGVTAHSVGVFAEGADYLADAAAIGVSLFAIGLSRRPPTARHPRGYPRATRLAAGVNAGWLLALCLLVAAEAADRLVSGVQRVDGLPVLVASGMAAAVMAGGAFVLRGDSDQAEVEGEEKEDHGDLTVRAVLLDTAADAVAAAGVAGAGAVILVAGGFYWLDPAVALAIAVVVGYHAVRLLGRVMAALSLPTGDHSSRRARGGRL